MKKLTFIVVLMGMAVFSHAQSKSVESLYNKYKSDKDFFHMDLAGNFLNFAEGMNLQLDKGQMGAITKSVERIKLFKLPVNGSVARADFKTLEKGLERERFELMMEISEKDNGIAMYSKGCPKINEIVLLISGKDNDDHMVIALEGEFDAQTIAKAGQEAVK
jgi:hypothetical protein